MHSSITVSQLIDESLTGDLILFNSRNTWYAPVIEYFTNSKFSHVGMVVKGVKVDGQSVDMCMLESGREPYPDAVDGRYIFGVRASPLSKVFEDYEPGRGGYIYYRRLTCKRTEGFYEQLSALINGVYGDCYDLLPQDWLRSAFGVDIGETQRTGTFWCSALVAYVYDKLGFVDTETPWTLIQPTQFSYYEGRQLSFKGIELEPELVVTK